MSTCLLCNGGLWWWQVGSVLLPALFACTCQSSGRRLDGQVGSPTRFSANCLQHVPPAEKCPCTFTCTSQELAASKCPRIEITCVLHARASARASGHSCVRAGPPGCPALPQDLISLSGGRIMPWAWHAAGPGDPGPAARATKRAHMASVLSPCTTVPVSTLGKPDAPAPPFLGEAHGTRVCNVRPEAPSGMLSRGHRICMFVQWKQRRRSCGSPMSKCATGRMWSSSAASDPNVCQWRLNHVNPCGHFDLRDPWQQRPLLPLEAHAAPVALGQHGKGAYSRTVRTWSHATHLVMAKRARQLGLYGRVEGAWACGRACARCGPEVLALLHAMARCDRPINEPAPLPQSRTARRWCWC